MSESNKPIEPKAREFWINQSTSDIFESERVALKHTTQDRKISIRHVIEYKALTQCQEELKAYDLTVKDLFGNSGIESLNAGVKSYQSQLSALQAELKESQKAHTACMAREVDTKEQAYRLASEWSEQKTTLELANKELQKECQRLVVTANAQWAGQNIILQRDNLTSANSLLSAQLEKCKEQRDGEYDAWNSTNAEAMKNIANEAIASVEVKNG